MTAELLRVRAPAKINLTLEVTGLLAGGYHELDTVFCWLELSDQVLLRRAEASELLLQGGSDEIPAGPDNLAWRALSALEGLTGRSLPCHITIEKKIPAGGGLGGGSADAAAVLWGLNELYQLGLNQQELAQVAAGLGADVAFGLWGGCARGRGSGAQLEWLESPGRLPLILFFPEFGCPTPAVYRAWDERQPRPAAGTTEAMVAALQNGRPIWLGSLLGNDLQPAAEQLFPQLSEYRQALQDCGCATLLSGSGSTLFGLLKAGQDPQPTLRRLAKLGRAELTHLCPLRREWH